MPNNVRWCLALSSNESQKSDFIGRQQELAVVTATLDDAMSGRGQMVMLSGEPGIGKTRTVQELATYAGLRGVQALWGRSYEEQGSHPTGLGCRPYIPTSVSGNRSNSCRRWAWAPLTPSRSSKLCGHWRPPAILETVPSGGDGGLTETPP